MLLEIVYNITGQHCCSFTSTPWEPASARGYDMASKVAKNAHKKNLTLKESAMELKALTSEELIKHIILSLYTCYWK
jgi:hypothetical protein